MKRLNSNQLKEISNFFTTSATAWFAAGVIAPLFSIPKNNQILILSILFGSSVAFVFMVISVMIIKGKQQWK